MLIAACWLSTMDEYLPVRNIVACQEYRITQPMAKVTQTKRLQDEIARKADRRDMSSRTAGG
jgi:hypothetical protein